jgi:hypothetical protein
MVTGCTLEQKLARSFVDLESPGQFLLLKPSFVFKYNLKEFEIPGIDTLDEYTKDSLLMEYSLFLKIISDSAIINEFAESFSATLESYGAKVLPENAIDTLMENGGTPHILNVAQFSMEEYIHPYSTEELVYDEIIVIDGIDLNAINFNVWIELGRMNTEKNNKVLFASDYLLDNINGTLKQHLITGNMSFDYTIDTITLPRIYMSARQFGKITAGYLYDYLMNSYIAENLPEDYPYERLYYHYDAARKLVYATRDEKRFLELESY